MRPGKIVGGGVDRCCYTPATCIKTCRSDISEKNFIAVHFIPNRCYCKSSVTMIVANTTVGETYCVFSTNNQVFSVTPVKAVPGQKNVQEGSEKDITFHVSLFHLHIDSDKRIRNTLSSDKDQNGRKGHSLHTEFTFADISGRNKDSPQRNYDKDAVAGYLYQFVGFPDTAFPLPFNGAILKAESEINWNGFNTSLTEQESWLTYHVSPTYTGVHTLVRIRYNTIRRGTQAVLVVFWDAIEFSCHIGMSTWSMAFRMKAASWKQTAKDVNIRFYIAKLNFKAFSYLVTFKYTSSQQLDNGDWLFKKPYVEPNNHLPPFGFQLHVQNKHIPGIAQNADEYIGRYYVDVSYCTNNDCSQRMMLHLNKTKKQFTLQTLLEPFQVFRIEHTAEKKCWWYDNSTTGDIKLSYKCDQQFYLNERYKLFSFPNHQSYDVNIASQKIVPMSQYEHHTFMYLIRGSWRMVSNNNQNYFLENTDGSLRITGNINYANNVIRVLPGMEDFEENRRKGLLKIQSNLFTEELFILCSDNVRNLYKPITTSCFYSFDFTQSWKALDSQITGVLFYDKDTDYIYGRCHRGNVFFKKDLRSLSTPHKEFIAQSEFITAKQLPNIEKMKRFNFQEFPTIDNFEFSNNVVNNTASLFAFLWK
ncbi:uncharacterized protein [Clytia hemisphaerica]